MVAPRLPQVPEQPRTHCASNGHHVARHPDLDGDALVYGHHSWPSITLLFSTSCVYLGNKECTRCPHWPWPTTRHTSDSEYTAKTTDPPRLHLLPEMGACSRKPRRRHSPPCCQVSSSSSRPLPTDMMRRRPTPTQTFRPTPLIVSVRPPLPIAGWQAQIIPLHRHHQSGGCAQSSPPSTPHHPLV